MEIDNNFIKKAYKYDFFLQIDLTAVNGLTLHVPPILDQTPSSPQRNTVIIANLFIKVSACCKSNILIVLAQGHGRYGSDEQEPEKNSLGNQ